MHFPPTGSFDELEQRQESHVINRNLRGCNANEWGNLKNGRSLKVAKLRVWRHKRRQDLHVPKEIKSKTEGVTGVSTEIQPRYI